MKKLIKRILREHKEFKDNLFNLLNSGQDENIEMVKYISEGQGYNLIDLLFGYFKEYGPPYFNIFNVLELTEEEQEFILTKIYGYITIKGRNSQDIRIYEYNGNQLYYENSDGFWMKYEYDDRGNMLYFEDSNGYWDKYEYDDNGNRIYYEDSDGYWEKREYDDKGKMLYWEDSDGEWGKFEYDKGNKIYWEDSTGYWDKYEYDDRGREIYHEDSDGYWEKREYDDRGREIYHEDSDGYIYDNR